MGYFIFSADNEIVGYGLDELGVEISDDCYLALWTLLPEYSGVEGDPLKGKWHTLAPDIRERRELLFAYSMIDCNGNVTDKGKAAIKAIQAIYDDDVAQAWAEVEAAELDDLDRQCRKRPKFNRYDG
jgi:hypothetical protein